LRAQHIGVALTYCSGSVQSVDSLEAEVAHVVNGVGGEQHAELGESLFVGEEAVHGEQFADEALRILRRLTRR
jgi:hypothetical protein